MVKVYDIYVSGGMTGLPDMNRANFHRITSRLRRAGLSVFNPAEIKGGEHWEWSDFMREAIRGQMQCHAIFMLFGHERSKGATVELNLARQLGMPVFNESILFENDWDRRLYRECGKC